MRRERKLPPNQLKVGRGTLESVARVTRHKVIKREKPNDWSGPWKKKKYVKP